MLRDPRASEGQSRSSWGEKAGWTDTRVKSWGMGHTEPNKSPGTLCFQETVMRLPRLQQEEAEPPSPPPENGGGASVSSPGV